MTPSVESGSSGGGGRLAGAVVTVAAAALSGGMVFAPWLGPGSAASSGLSLTGWDISDAATGSQKWFIGDFFDEFSPFFPGLTVLAVAAVVGLIGIGLFMARRPVGRGVAVLLGLVGVVAFLLPMVNVASVLITGPGSDVVFFGWGLVGALLGGIGAVVGIQMATLLPRRSRRLRSGVQ